MRSGDRLPSRRWGIASVAIGAVAVGAGVGLTAMDGQPYSLDCSGDNRRPGEKPKNFKETVSRFVPLLKPFIPGMVVVLIAGVIGTVLTVTGISARSRKPSHS